MGEKIVKLKRGKEDSLNRWHPWIFSGAIASVDPGVAEGDTVAVYSSDRLLIGRGHFAYGSIAVRVIAWGDQQVDGNLYGRLLNAAWKMRQDLGIPGKDSDCYRLVHGEGDWLPGLVVDVYGSTAVLQAHSAGMHYARHTIANALTQIPGAGIKSVYYKSEATLPFKANIEAENEYIIGKAESDIATENGLHFAVDWLKGQKTGFFLDQRENRCLVEQYSHGRRLLNMMCYTGGFSVYALRGGAERVDSVDSSSLAIELARRNVALNFPGCTKHTAFAEDAFRFLAKINKGDYDMIILDPPAFAKHRSAVHNALIGYRRLNAKAIEQIGNGGLLFTFSCSQAVSREEFRLAVMTAAAQTGRRVRILQQLSQPPDHPINIFHPESEYLKGLLLYIE